MLMLLAAAIVGELPGTAPMQAYAAAPGASVGDQFPLAVQLAETLPVHVLVHAGVALALCPIPMNRAVPKAAAASGATKNFGKRPPALSRLRRRC